MEALARQTVEAFGTVDLLCNNAGIARIGNLWESTLADWESVIGINLWGVINGVRSFVPIMLTQETECHIVNTASLSGHISAPGGAAYNVAKHGVVTLSETLYHELAEREARISVSVLCPGMVNTRIVESMRRGPTEPADSATEARLEALRQLVQTGMPAAQVADAVFEALQNKQFYILTHPDGKDAIRTRMEDIIQQRDPTPIA